MKVEKSVHVYHSGFLCGYIEFIIMVWNGIRTKLIWKIKKKKGEPRCTFWGKFKTFSAWYARMEIYLSPRTDLSSSTFMSWATMSKKIIGGTKIEMLSIMWCVKSASCSFPSEPFHQSQFSYRTSLNLIGFQNWVFLGDYDA